MFKSLCLLDNNMDSIVELDEKIRGLKRDGKELFERIYCLTCSVGLEDIPDTFIPKQLAWFGDANEKPEQTLERARNQKVVRIYNKHTFEGASFNDLRARKPAAGKDDPEARKKIEEHIQSKFGDDFCNPFKFTAFDIGIDEYKTSNPDFRIESGRVIGTHCVTASNSAKCDGGSGMVIFNEHNPLKFSLEQLTDYFFAAQEWFRAIHFSRSEFVYPAIGWNCLEKAAASQVHGHMHIVLGKDFHYAEAEKLRKCVRDYRNTYNRDYFDDLTGIYYMLGLSLHKGDATIMAELTPAKEKGVMIVSRELDKNALSATYDVLRCFIDRLGVVSFNAAILMPPVEKRGLWRDFPYVIRIVDRGNTTSASTTISSTADVGAMELFVNNIIGSDPYKVIEKIRKYSEVK